jgi:plastocyanin
MTRPHAYLFLAGATALMIVAASACRTQVPPATTGQSGEPAAVIVISDNPAEFVPSTVTVKAGDAVEWRNTGGISHSVDFLEPRPLQSGASPEGGVIAPNHTYIRTFLTPGTYKYVCRFHIINGMTGKVVVTPDQHAGP